MDDPAFGHLVPRTGWYNHVVRAWVEGGETDEVEGGETDGVLRGTERRWEAWERETRSGYVRERGDGAG